jgi:hypothetical protein
MNTYADTNTDTVETLMEHLSPEEIKQMKDSLGSMTEKEIVEMIYDVVMIMSDFLRRNDISTIISFFKHIPEDEIENWTTPGKREFQLIICALIIDHTITNKDGSLFVKFLTDLDYIKIDNAIAKYFG